MARYKLADALDLPFKVLWPETYAEIFAIVSGEERRAKTREEKGPSNWDFSHWGKIFDAVTASAILDRLTVAGHVKLYQSWE
ncbi:MAG: hypothetical protein PHI34_12360 [Acidobacteriota bacterium]|nr:hypothetical protein [Acidobacteriota bacterium]